jgi:hypothetical protein
MAPMRTIVRPGVLLTIAIVVAACGDPSPPASPTTATSTGTASPGATSSAATPTPVPANIPPPTPVPVASSGTTIEPQEPTQPPGGGSTGTEWGAILDVVPDGFPVIPGGRPAEGQSGPASGWWLAETGVDEVAGWYQGALAELGFTVGDLSSPLEDGSRVLDVSSDLPECRVQLAFRPADGSTIIRVLYGAGCAGGEG